MRLIPYIRFKIWFHLFRYGWVNSVRGFMVDRISFLGWDAHYFHIGRWSWFPWVRLSLKCTERWACPRRRAAKTFPLLRWS